MKKVFLFAALAVALYSCKGGANKDGGNADSGKKTEAPAEASLIGKWMVVDMQMKTPPGQTPKPEEIKASVIKDSMMFDFSADGKVITSSKPIPASTGTYTKNGNKLEVTGAKGDKQLGEISNLTATGFSLTMKGPKPDDDVTLVMQKM